MSTEAIRTCRSSSATSLNFVTFLPGVETTGTARASTIMGLPQTAINLTIDGSSVSNPLQSGDGFYAQVFPKLDAIEEVTMTGAGTDAASAAQGTIQVKFVTKSGTNVYKGTGYEYMRNKAFNTNYFFNKVNGLDRNAVNDRTSSAAATAVRSSFPACSTVAARRSSSSTWKSSICRTS